MSKFTNKKLLHMFYVASRIRYYESALKVTEKSRNKAEIKYKLQLLYNEYYKLGGFKR